MFMFLFTKYKRKLHHSINRQSWGSVLYWATLWWQQAFGLPRNTPKKCVSVQLVRLSFRVQIQSVVTCMIPIMDDRFLVQVLRAYAKTTGQVLDALTCFLCLLTSELLVPLVDCLLRSHDLSTAHCHDRPSRPNQGNDCKCTSP